MNEQTGKGLDIEGLYHAQLMQLQADNQKDRYDDMNQWHHASGCGTCYKKHYWNNVSADQMPKEPRNMRLLRLGDLVHGDVQDAIMKQKKDTDEITIEEEIRIPSLGVRGHLDIKHIDHETKIITIYDIKTMATRSWSGRFGHIKNRDTDAVKFYEMQLATYLMGILPKHPGYGGRMVLWFYKKDDSYVRVVQIDDSYLISALQYWKEVNRLLPTLHLSIPAVDMGVPQVKWECNYCSYMHICGSPFTKPELIKDYVTPTLGI